MAPSVSSPRATASPARATPTAALATGNARKRHHTSLDDAALEPLGKPMKRPKVAFHPEVQVEGTPKWERGIDQIREDVQQAIERHRLGDSGGYARIMELFTTSATAEDAPSPIVLRSHVRALTSIVSQLNKTCSGLVHAVLACEWLGRDESFVFLFIRFLGHLLSAQGGYVDAVLRMLVENLTSIPSSAGRLPGYYPVRRSEIYSRTHLALRYVLELVPFAASALITILSASFPHSTASKRAHTAYIKNLLKLTEYLPVLKTETLALITERLVKIDVQVQVDMDELEEDAEERLVRGVSPGPEGHTADSDHDSVSSDESTSSMSSMDEETRRMWDLRSNVEKMDTILDILFEFYSAIFTAAAPATEVEWAFEMLLNHFATIILPTYRSRHSQFLLFHFAQSSQVLVDRFAGECVHLAFEKSRPSLLRQSSAAYLASFVARGAHVSAQVVRDVFQLLGVHLDNFRAEREVSCHGPDLRRYGTFYSLVQALLYIFCFRWRDLALDPDGLLDDEEPASLDAIEISWAPGVKDVLMQAIYSKLNPLKVCSPSIVNEFARIAHHLRFMYVYPLLESNKRLHLSQSSACRELYASHGHAARDARFVGQKNESHYRLDAYFPFDPYKLPISKRWLRGDYVEWQGIPGLDDEDAGVDEEDEEGEEGNQD